MIRERRKGMRILIQNPIYAGVGDPKEETVFNITKMDFEAVKRPDTEVVIKTLDKEASTSAVGLYLFDFLGSRFFNDVEIVRNMLNAEKEGFDGVVDSCFFDPALQVAKSLINIPVVGPREACMHMAAMMRGKFAIITSEPSYIPSMSEAVY
jgi:Asp/Glu/hydantoin racemase